MLGLRRTGDTEGGVEFFFGAGLEQQGDNHDRQEFALTFPGLDLREPDLPDPGVKDRSEEHTSDLQSRLHLVCRLLLEKKKTQDPDKKERGVDARAERSHPPATHAVRL